MTTSSILTKNQKKIFGWKAYNKNGEKYRIKATVRYDDECGNGHNSFSITGETQRRHKNRHWMEDSCGCIHEEITKHFPELAPFIKWHLVSSDSPRGYVENTVYFAGNRDCCGKTKGEPYNYEHAIIFNDVPMPYKNKSQKFMNWLKEQQNFDFEIFAIEHDKTGGYDFDPNYTIGNYPCEKWHECPFDSEEDASRFIRALQTCKIKWIKTPTSFGKGKEREFDKARDAAIWPDASDEILSLPKEELKALLLKRLPKLMSEFKRDVESLGFIY